MARVEVSALVTRAIGSQYHYEVADLERRVLDRIREGEQATERLEALLTWVLAPDELAAAFVRAATRYGVQGGPWMIGRDANEWIDALRHAIDAHHMALPQDEFDAAMEEPNAGDFAVSAAVSPTPRERNEEGR